MRLQGNLKSLSMFVIAVGITPALVLHAPMVRADTIPIDSFAAPAVGANFASIDLGLLPLFVGGAPIVPSASGEPSILGGDRDVTVAVTAPIDWKSVVGTIGSGSFSVYTGGRSGSTVTIDYPGLTNEDLTDLGTNNAIALGFTFVSKEGMNVQIMVTDNGNTATFDSLAIGDIAGSTTTFTYLAPFNAFDTVAPLASADSISIVFNSPAGGPVPNVDFELTSIAAVPEPSTLAMLLTLGLVSLAAIARRRRKR